MTPKVGWIGTGIMGKSMCGHLINAGYKVAVYNRTKEKAKDLIAKGAAWANTPKEVAEQSDIVFTIVGYPADVKDVILSNKDSVFSGAKKGLIIVDMTTSQPELAKKIYEEAKKKGIHSLDAPVTGGDVGAKNATLSIMVGGDKEIFQKVEPLLKHMGKVIIHAGEAGAGQQTKICNQIAVGVNLIGNIETLMYAQKAGLDLEKTLQVIGNGGGASWSISNLGPRIIKKDFAPGFFIKHFIKDLNIALEECKKMKLHLPGLQLVHKFCILAKEYGYENDGTQALYKVLEKMNNEMD